MTTPATEEGVWSDEALMDALQAGDDQALAALMERWELPVKSFLLRLGVSRADVEDVAQDSFVRLYQKRGVYRTGAAFKPWLFTLAGNLGRNRLRWRFRRREDSIDALNETWAQRLEPVDHSTPTASALMEKSHRAEQVRIAIAALPQKLRETVVCVEMEELSYQETATILSCTVKAVETRLYRAKQLLRAACTSLLDQD